MNSSLMRGDTAENSIMQTISIAVSAILIAAGLITAPSLINNARDVNGKGDLAAIAMAQEYSLADVGEYQHHLYDMVKNANAKMTTSGRDIIIFHGNNPVCHSAFAKSASGETFYRTSAATSTSKMPTIWPLTAPAGYPSNCNWPLNPALSNVPINPTGNLAAAVPLQTSTAGTLTQNVSYGGTTWNRLVVSAPMQQVRQRVNVSDLINDKTYIAQWEVANDGPADVTLAIDWSDQGYFYYTIKPGERRVISTNGARPYDATYSFTDIALETLNGSGILFRQITVKQAP